MRDSNLVRIMVDSNITNEQMSQFIKKIPNIRIGWDPESDDTEEQLAPTLQCWMDIEGGYRQVGTVCAQDDLMMRDRLMAHANLMKHGGIGRQSFPVEIDGDGMATFSVELLD